MANEKVFESKTIHGERNLRWLSCKRFSEAFRMQTHYSLKNTNNLDVLRVRMLLIMKSFKIERKKNRMKK